MPSSDWYIHFFFSLFLMQNTIRTARMYTTNTRQMSAESSLIGAGLSNQLSSERSFIYTSPQFGKNKIKPTKMQRLSARKKKNPKNLLGNTVLCDGSSSKEGEQKNLWTDGGLASGATVCFCLFFKMVVWLTGRINATFDSRRLRESHDE